ncbi:hypothetical protein FISHEDRAFT_65817 [Fistulina hepatica ATCC 64428]|uniref:Senescence domain-containing protein n=1 Tax=Fistulina hepatica ATCC 64428 TaxID=1128425 RepID=A0A0D7ABQ9_9AGAR|nr:hypothetical protein FISHEDRAFT_65817 [Fistulina hepatica ATCC 64428]
MGSSPPEVFSLYSLSDVSLNYNGVDHHGEMYLDCVLMPDGSVATQYLVVRVDTLEIPIEPNRAISVVLGPSGCRTYTFHLETLEEILSQYTGTNEIPRTAISPLPLPSRPVDQKDLHGRLVLVDQDSGEIVGEVDNKVNVHEDPTLRQVGREKYPVVIEIPDKQGHDAEEMELFVRAVPPEESNWMTTSAKVMSTAITETTNLLVANIEAASSYYVSHSAPSPHHPSAGQKSTDGEPTPASRTAALLQSQTTRGHLNTLHTYSEHAVKASAKTVALVDDIIWRLVGGKGKGKGKATPNNSSTPFTVSPVPMSPPAVNTPPLGEKPALPPRRSPTPSPKAVAASPASMLSPLGQPPPYGPPPLPPRSAKGRLVLSADLILSTIDHSSHRLLDASAVNFGKIVGHRYGAEAEQQSLLAAGTVRNIGLVYIDLSGIGRSAIIKKMAKEYVKNKLSTKSKIQEAKL